MVLINLKISETNQFLYEIKSSEPIDEVIKQLVMSK